jgi:hypothetical protein
MRIRGLLFALLCLIAAAFCIEEGQVFETIGTAKYTPPRPNGPVVFFEPFDDSWNSRWVLIKSGKYTGALFNYLFLMALLSCDPSMRQRIDFFHARMLMLLGEFQVAEPTAFAGIPGDKVHRKYFLLFECLDVLIRAF